MRLQKNLELQNFCYYYFIFGFIMLLGKRPQSTIVHYSSDCAKLVRLAQSRP